MLAALAHAVDARVPHARGHAGRVVTLAEAVAIRLGWSDARVASVRLGALLHDVGKLAIAVELVAKAGPLTAAEHAEIRTHPAAGARIVGHLGSARIALPSILYHHERWDGTGYPTGKRGPQIPLEARLLASADAYDAMTSTRPYRVAVSHDAALEEIARCAGTQFDPRLAEVAGAVWQTATRVAV